MKNKIIILTILFVAFLLRFWKLDSYPALNADEAAIGYNAYSLIQTGMDEHRNSWPIHFQSFNDYKPGLYFYLVLPFIKSFGLNEWSVRAPGAFLGVATVLILYFLVKELFNDDRVNSPTIKAKYLALIASFFLAISPWHIHFSRGGWEVNVATFFVVSGVYLFLKGRRNLAVLMLSALSFALSLYTYHAARIIVPLLGLGMLFIFRDDFKKNWKNFLLAGLVVAVAVLPLIKDFTRSEITSRAAGVGLFADTGPISRINEQRGEHQDFLGILPKVLHNKYVNYSRAFLENWSEHYHGLFLFLSGDDIQRNKVPETGQMYLSDILWIFVGIWWLIRTRNRATKLILWWLAVAPSAAALTFQSPHALRAQNMIIPLTMISAYGFLVILKHLFKMKNRLIAFSALGFIIALIFWQFTRYEHMYWIHMAKEYPFSSQYGVKELVSYLNQNDRNYQKVLVTDRYDQPYILFLFYLKYSPVYFQAGHVLSARDKFGFSTVRGFDKYEFRPINWDFDQPNNANALIVGTDEDIPDEANIVKEIYGSNGYKYFQVVAN
jgi:4-amino-4-deoxy-L-arabinose transferase-like glycosyltransferase